MKFAKLPNYIWNIIPGGIQKLWELLIPMGKTLTLEQPQIIQEVLLIPYEAENAGAATS